MIPKSKSSATASAKEPREVKRYRVTTFRNESELSAFLLSTNWKVISVFSSNDRIILVGEESIWVV